MSVDLRRAAEEILRADAARRQRNLPEYPLEGWAVALARDFLAHLGASRDNQHEPNVEWLVAVGFEKTVDEDGWVELRAASQATWHGDRTMSICWLVCEPGLEGAKWSVNNIAEGARQTLIPNPETRGQVRQLCFGLNIPLRPDRQTPEEEATYG